MSDRERESRTMRTDALDHPPNSRLFIVCGKHTNEDEFREAFSQYGEIQDIWIVRDRKTNEHKGVTYIKYSKTSEAALAMEEMHGKTLGSIAKPLKVLIASNRQEGNKKDMHEEERLVRLFVIVPKSWTEDNLRDAFREYGDIDYVNVVKDKATGDSRGLAYVKFEKASQAARALENCDKSFKAVFAEPRGSRERSQSHGFDGSHGGGGPGGPAAYNGSAAAHAAAAAAAGMMMMDTSGPGGAQGHHQQYSQPQAAPQSGGAGANRYLNIMVSHGVTGDQLHRLCDLVPGLEYCDLRRGYAIVCYSSPQWAHYAKEKLQCVEYPQGSRLMVKFADEDRSGGRGGAAAGYDQYGQAGGMGSAEMQASNILRTLNQAVSQLSASNGSAGYGMQQQQQSGGAGGYDSMSTLTSVLAQANELLGQYGMGVQGGGAGQQQQAPPPPPPQAQPMQHHHQQQQAYGGGGPAGYTTPAVQCSVGLPSVKACVGPHVETAQRLFIVCNPRPLPEHTLLDVFSRFGNLIEIHMLPNKNYGYAKYADARSAQDAIDTLHMQEVDGCRIKVMEAEPDPKRGDNQEASNRKRMRSALL